MSRIENEPDGYGLDAFREIVARKRSDGFFDPGRPVVVTRAPGRLDVMGGIADYSGSLVLQYPIREGTFAAAQFADDGKIRVESVADVERLKTVAFETGVDELAAGGKLGSPREARAYFSSHGEDRWAAYVVGAFVVLADALKVKFERGVRVLVHSDVPFGKGVSSSAALEVSVMKALLDLHSEDNAPANRDVSCRDLALLCQRVENEIVGAPCGVMDQMVSACAAENELVEILCQPAELIGGLAVPEEIGIWGIDSDIKHSVAGGGYGTVRTAAAMGYRMIAAIAGLSVRNAGPGRVTIGEGEWNGYLANIDAAVFRDTLEPELPERVRGRDFLTTFYGVSDRFASIDPETAYPVRAATAHPVYENARVRRFARVLKSGKPDLEELGRLMYGSHESYSACGLGSDGTDLIVELVREAGPASGLFGAKITGGGGGGTVAVLGRRGSDAAVEQVAREYENRAKGRRARIFSGSSPGAFSFGRVAL